MTYTREQLIEANKKYILEFHKHKISEKEALSCAVKKIDNLLKYT